MFKFQNEQKVFNIGGVNFGGQPGERRTVLIGSLFYPGHSIVKNRMHGEIDMVRLEEIISAHDEMMACTKCNAALMIYAETTDSMYSYIKLLPELTELPLFIDSPSSEVKLAGIRRAIETGLGDKVVYNTLSLGSSQGELEALAQMNVKSAMLLAFNPRNLGVKGKIYLLENGGGILSNGLIDIAKNYGIEKPLIDVAVMSFDQNAGSALRAIVVSKAKWGLPTGCAVHNAVESWSLLAKLKERDLRVYREVDTASPIIPIMAGADFVVYGPIEYYRSVFPIATFADELIRQAVQDI
ncbi:MAG: hypothetical protein QXN93_02835 [Methanomassiliicoccales archaeon]